MREFMPLVKTEYCAGCNKTTFFVRQDDPEGKKASFYECRGDMGKREIGCRRRIEVSSDLRPMDHWE